MAIAVAAVMMVLMTTPAGPAGRAEAAGPEAGTYFEYEIHQRVKGGEGSYLGWHEDTEGEGRYEVLSWGPVEATMRARYSWTYENDDGESDSGKEDRTFSFDLANRTYTSARIDLDDLEYASMPPSELGQWVWVPPTVKEGQTLHILDDEYTVTDTDATLWSKGLPRRVIEVVARGSGHVVDDYGDLDYTYVDRLYYDRGTGMFFAERYAEHDTGDLDGYDAAFDNFVHLDVTDSSYHVDVAWGEFAWIYARNLVILGFVLWLLGIVVSRYVHRPRRYPMQATGLLDTTPQTTNTWPIYPNGEVRVSRVRRAAGIAGLEVAATDQFAPFLTHWADKALRCRDRVAVATVKQAMGVNVKSPRPDLVVGFAMYNREGRIGTILCRSTEMCELLRRFIRCKDFFTETRHTIKPDEEMRSLPTLMRALQKSRNEAYNVFEEHRVYRIRGLLPTAYDTDLVRPMRRTDLSEASRVARRAFRQRSRRWVRSCLDAGDLGFVAVVGGRVVGLAFACLEGDRGRLHTLAVDPSHRGRGIGKELHRARLEALRQLGASEAITEIADWNLASIRISTLAGMRPEGSMYVETVRTKRIKKDIVRR